MSLALLGARLLLAGVFATAGLAKLADREGSRRAVAEFGVPRRLAWLVGGLLPLVELAAAGLLVPGASARFGALLAAALLLAFSAAIAVNLRRGRAPECRCFGQVHSAPVTWRAVVRNLALAVLAAAITLNAGTVLDRIEALGAGLAIVLGALLLVARGGKRAEDVPLDFSEGLPVGSDAPAFELRSREGDTVALEALLARGKPVVLLFTDAHCGPCVSLAPEVAEWQRSLSEQLTIAVLERAGRERNVGPDEHGRGLVLYQQDEEVAQAYLAEGTPVAVLVDPDGKVASDIAPGSTAIRRLVGAQTGEPVQEPEPEWESGWAREHRLPRRELLVRFAAGVALAAPFLASPARAFARAFVPRAERPCKPKCGKFADCDDSLCRCLNSEWPDLCGIQNDCTNFLFDHKNCGGCVAAGAGKKCGKTEICAGRKCLDRKGDDTCVDPCPPSGDKICCKGQCIDPKTNEKFCGGCGAAPCEGKKPTCCSGICRDLHGDPKHCGGCDKPPCPKDKPICYEGKCLASCPPNPTRPGTNLKRCGNTCGDPKTEFCCLIDDDNPSVGGVVYDDTFNEFSCCNGVVRKNTNKRCGHKCTECGGSNVDCCNGKCVAIGTEANCRRCGDRCKKFELCEGADRGCTCPLGAKCHPPLPHP